MAVVIGDIHGSFEMAAAFLAYHPEEEHIAVGDLVDSRKGVTSDEELACLDLLLASDSILLWGNHDLNYLQDCPWHLGYNLNIRGVLSARFESARNRFMAAYAVDGWLCTHAGVSSQVARVIPADVLATGSGSIAGWLNQEFSRELKRFAGPLFHRSFWRGGTAEFGGIFWFDQFAEMRDPSPLVGRQIFGHTPVPEPDISEYWVNLNCFEGDEIWVYNTKEQELVDLSGSLPTSGGKAWK